MHPESPVSPLMLSAIARLESCRLFEGAPKEFWRLFVQTAGEVAGGTAARVVVRTGEDWRLAATWGDAREFGPAASGAAFHTLATQALQEGLAAANAQNELQAGLAVVALATGNASEACLLVVAMRPGRREDLSAAGAVLRLAADTPALYQRQRQLEQAKRDLVHYTQALEILAATNAQTRFLAVAMALVNELAARFNSPRVALGWTEGPYVRLKAISGTDRFEKKMAAVQRLEAAMEEARDQDEEILYPPLPDNTAIVRDHEAYRGVAGCEAVLSVPVRLEGEARGVLTLERATAFTVQDAAAVRVVADQVARRLADLRRQDRWFGARWAAAARENAARWLGPQHTGWKLTGLVASAALLVAVFVPFSYRVEAPFIVRADALAHLPAPFDGYLAQAPVRPGDVVAEGALLAALDVSELRVEEASAQADLRLAVSEAEKAESERRLADLRVAQAQQAQARARLELVRHRLVRAELRAPFAGVVVEGDLRERIGAPVRTGDLLLKVSQLKDLYVEVKVPERDIDLVGGSRRGQIAFASRPEDTFDFRVERLEPAALAEREGNVFLLRGELDGRADWFRPGMSGVAKVDAGRRSLLWIATHRLVDFLRLKLWW